MKKLFFAIFALLLVLSATVPARAGTTNLLNLQVVNGTNNGATFSASGIYIPPQKFLFQNLGLTNVNGNTSVLTINVQISVDAANSNWVTLATYTPSITNAQVDSFNPTFNAVTLPMRAQVITTNATSVSTFLTQ